jgi:hypothetical protein
MTRDFPLSKFSKNIYSQNGEDHIILELFNRLEIYDLKSVYCCEFGAWDGSYLSNTFNLVEKGASAILIEGDPTRFDDLSRLVKRFKKVTAIQANVSHNLEDNNSLDKILSKTEIPKDFDLLSIDIDSYDLDVFESLTNYNPKIVIIEINSGVLPGIHYRHSKNTPGNTFSATLKVALEKKYTLVHHCGNMIFVKNDFKFKLNFPKKFFDFPELLFDSSWVKN